MNTYQVTYYIGKKSHRPFTATYLALDDENAKEMAEQKIYMERGYPNKFTILKIEKVEVSNGPRN